MHIFAINSITHNQNQNPLLDLLWYSPDIIYKRWVFLLLNVPITGLCNFPANFLVEIFLFADVAAPSDVFLS